MCDMGVVQFSFAGSKAFFLNHHHYDYFSVVARTSRSPGARDTLLICTSCSGVNYSTVLERRSGLIQPHDLL